MQALSTKKYQIPLPASAHELTKMADIPIEVAEAATVSEANTALHRAWDRLKECQRDDVNLRAKWLEGVARVKGPTKETMTPQRHSK